MIVSDRVVMLSFLIVAGLAGLAHAGPEPTIPTEGGTQDEPIRPTRMGADAAWDGTGSPPDVRGSEEVLGVEVAAKLGRMPSGIAAVGERLFIAVPRWDGGPSTLHEWRDGALRPWPSERVNDASAGADRLHSVNGLRLDARGRLWVLDNARIDLGAPAPGAPKLIAYDPATGEELWRHVFPSKVAPPTSFMNDVAIDAKRGFAYLTETGMGGPGALVVVDLNEGRSWRVIEGHPSVSADASLTMTIDGTEATLLRAGERQPWRVGANQIALTDGGETLLFGPMTGRTLYAVPTSLLRDPSSRPQALRRSVKARSDKPMSDGMDVLADGRPVLTDVENAALVTLPPDGRPTKLVESTRWFVFPVAIHAVDAETLYFSSNQLQGMPLLHGGEDKTTPPYWVWRVRLKPSR
ncbi:MAG: hypothetical protein EA397_11610 [Deltaproteobacteria bacterium]|nr:MAG: hypothetical protein EA397_11610 [Deltaproteobacteria bacterium]